MTAMQKFKEYFGMVPPSAYEDDYFEEPLDTHGNSPRERAYHDRYRSADRQAEPFYDDEDRFRGPAHRDPAPRDSGYREAEYRESDYRDADYRDADYRGRHDADYRDAAEPARNVRARGGFQGAAVAEAPRPRLEPLSRSANATLRQAPAAPELASRSERDGGSEVGGLFDGPLNKITTLRPADYSEARTIGERFRDGSPVIMDLVDMSNDDAKRLVDFAAGLAFALRGSFDKVATKVFLLSPADIDVTPEDRRRIAETGFYNHS